MSVLPSPKREPARPRVLLENGDRMTQPEFHRRYEQCPENFRAELIGGIVYVASPTRRRHGNHLPELSGILCLYKGATPGVEILAHATTILSSDSEVQPDLALHLLAEYGGRSSVNTDEYIVGAPELIAEISHSNYTIDLHQKRLDYERAGVLEYVVWTIGEPELHWFDFASGESLRPNRQGIYKSRVFPGLWIDWPALLNRDTLKLAAVIQQGVASRAHAAFVKKLAAVRRKNGGD